jgi:hypothetical protein
VEAQSIEIFFSIEWKENQSWNFNLMKLIMENVLSSSTLLKTVIMVNSTSFKYSKNALTTMTFETKLPHNLFV